MNRQYSIFLLAIVSVLILTTTTPGVNGECIIPPQNKKKGVPYKVEIKLNWNKKSDKLYDPNTMKPGYVIVVVHNTSFNLFNESVAVIPQVKLLIEENTLIDSKKLGTESGTLKDQPRGLKNLLAFQTGVYRGVSSFKDPASDGTVKLNALVNGTHTYISILGALQGKKDRFYGTKAPIQLCLKDNKPLTAGLPSAALTAYKLNAKNEPVVDNSLTTNYGSYKLGTGSYWNLANECFPKNARVSLQDGRRVYMEQLKVGDSVAVGNGKFSNVFMFTHQLPHAVTNFVQLTTSAGNVLKLTPGHFIPVNTYQYKPAKDVRQGDKVRLEDGSVASIVDIEAVEEIGLYNPQTTHGDIVVDGVVASTYTVTIPPKTAHAMLAPLRGLAARFASYGAFPVSSTA